MRRFSRISEVVLLQTDPAVQEPDKGRSMNRALASAVLVGEVGELAPDLVRVLTQLGARPRVFFKGAHELLEFHCYLSIVSPAV